MSIDTSRTVLIEASPGKLLLLVGLGVLMAGASALLTFLNDDFGLYGKAVGWVGLIFFGFCTLVALWRLLARRGPVITISPEGFRDTRVAADIVPWPAITNISTWSWQGQEVMVLAVQPVVEKSLVLTAIARWTRGANRALGADGLAVTASGVKIDHAALIDAATAYWQAHRAR